MGLGFLCLWVFVNFCLWVVWWRLWFCWGLLKNRSFELCWRWVCNLDEEMGLFVFCSVSGWGPQFWQKVWLKRRNMWLSIETKWVLFWVSEKIEFEWWIMCDENWVTIFLTQQALSVSTPSLVSLSLSLSLSRLELSKLTSFCNLFYQRAKVIPITMT